MVGRRKDPLKLNEIKTSLPVFMESYIKSMPAGFPLPTIEILKIFQTLHPALFKRGDEWSIDRHRKRIMDWLPSYDLVSLRKT